MKLQPLAGIKSVSLGTELSAGVTLLAISLPLNIGYAQIAGLPASAGLLALILPTLVFVLLASTRVVVAAPDAAGSALVFSSLTGLHVSQGNMLEMAGAQAIICGVALALCGLFKLGFIASFLSKPIMLGFVAGLALEILLSQLFKMTAVPKAEHGGFFVELWHLISHLFQLNLPTTLLALGGLALLIVGRKLAPNLPWALAVLVLGTVVVGVFGLKNSGISVLGQVESASLTLSFPVMPWSQWVALIPSGVALAFVMLADTLMLTRSYAEKFNHKDQDPNQDLLALAAANVVAGGAGSFAQGSSASRSAAVTAVGARTQIPSLVLVCGSLLVLLFGLELLANIPNAIIGAVVAVAVFGLLELKEFRALFGLSRAEFGIAVVCVVGVLVLGPLQGLFFAFVLAAINLIRKAAQAPAEVLTGEVDPMMSLLDADSPRKTLTAPGVQVFRFAGPLFFANSDRFVERIQAAVEVGGGEIHSFVLDTEGISEIDVTGAHALEQVHRWLERRSIRLGYSRLRADLADRLDHFGLLEGVTVFDTNRAAVAAWKSE